MKSSMPLLVAEEEDVNGIALRQSAALTDSLLRLGVLSYPLKMRLYLKMRGMSPLSESECGRIVVCSSHQL